MRKYRVSAYTRDGVAVRAHERGAGDPASMSDDDIEAEGERLTAERAELEHDLAGYRRNPAPPPSTGGAKPSQMYDDPQAQRLEARRREVVNRLARLAETRRQREGRAETLSERPRKAADRITADDALATVLDMRAAVDRVLARGDESEAVVAELAKLRRMLDGLSGSPADPDSDAWAKVDRAVDDLIEWLGQPADNAPEKRRLTREEQMRLAIAVATRGRGARRGRGGDPAELIVSTFEKGLVGAVKLAWAATRLAVRAGIAAGRLAYHGAVRVHEYVRDGRTVRAHERGAPSKASRIDAHTLYR